MMLEHLGSFLALNDWVKALLIVLLPVMLLGAIAMVLHHRRARWRRDVNLFGRTLYSMAELPDGAVRLYRHEPKLEKISHDGMMEILATKRRTVTRGLATSESMERRMERQRR